MLDSRSEATSTKRHLDIASATRWKFKVFGCCGFFFRIDGHQSFIRKLLFALRFGSERQCLIQKIAAFTRFPRITFHGLNRDFGLFHDWKRLNLGFDLLANFDHNCLDVFLIIVDNEHPLICSIFSYFRVDQPDQGTNWKRNNMKLIKQIIKVQMWHNLRQLWNQALWLRFVLKK